MRNFLYTGLTLLGALSLAACASAGRTAAWEKTEGATAAGTATSSAAAASLMTEADGHWAKRDDKGQLMQAIQVWEKAVAEDAKNADALVMLSRAHYFLADGFLAVEGAPQAEEFQVYQKGVDYGERALLLLDPGFEAQMRAEAKFEDAIKGIGKDALPAAYWYAVNLGRFASKQGLSQRLFYKDKLKATMERIMELDPGYFHGAADRYFGAFYALLPSIAGKDLKKSAEHFARSLELAPGYLGTKVVQAQFLAVEQDDEALYRKLLDEVIQGNADAVPEVGPENRAAQRTAKKMLDGIDEVF
jgi:hypothetical protein